jgi:ribosomal subunit interface protein
MILNVSGHQVTIGESLQEYVKDKIESKVKKFFKEAISVHVTFGKDGIFFSAEIIVNDGVKHQAILKGDGKGGDAYSAFEDALHKTDIQLRKHKELIKSHHKNHHKKTRKDDYENF